MRGRRRCTHVHFRSPRAGLFLELEPAPIRARGARTQKNGDGRAEEDHGEELALKVQSGPMVRLVGLAVAVIHRVSPSPLG
ncbi:MAG TPA: hypothetical protein VEH29_01615 [Acidimicrobiales bacterium]|nr:hypothetical protein [Acidimicrobiales bacterium]